MDGRRGERRHVAVDWGRTVHRARGALSVCPGCHRATVPGAAGVMQGLEALQTPDWGGSEAAGGGGNRAKQHAGGAHAFSGIPAVGLRLHGFVLKPEA